jgi:hypothetical protein
MSTQIENIIVQAKNNNEKLLLFAYFFIILGTAWPLFQTLGQAWQSSEIVRPLIYTINIYLGISLEEFSAICFGFYIGLLSLFTIDPKKRWQGLLLWLGTTSGLVALLTVDLFIPNINFVANAIWVISGLLVGVIIGGGRQALQVRTAQSLEFRKAAQLIFFIISVIIIIGLIEYHVSFPELIAVSGNNVSIASVSPNISFNSDGAFLNFLLAGVFIATLNRFVEYDASKSYFALGPKESGKSLFLVGMYLAALNEAESRVSDAPLNPSSDLMNLVSNLDSGSQESGWDIGATDATDVNSLHFNYISGKIFPKNISLFGLDYAGEYLSDLPSALVSPPRDIDNTTLKILKNEIEITDTLILVLDAERYSNGESLEIEPYFDILKSLSDKNVMLVATKADILAEEFKKDRGLEAYQYFNEFREYVNQEFTEGNQNIRTLVQDTSGTEIQPVYYQTRVTDNGERVPMRDSRGNVNIVGFDELLEEMG